MSISLTMLVGYNRNLISLPFDGSRHPGSPVPAEGTAGGGDNGYRNQHDTYHVLSLRTEKFEENDLPEYEALSYVWGLPVNPENLLVFRESISAHASLSITQNSACALQHPRRVDCLPVMWIDAICID